MNIKKLCKNKKGFTLIEIIVVVVILAVLFAVAVPSVMKYMNEADDAKYISQTRGAYIEMQTQLAKEVAKDADNAINAGQIETTLNNCDVDGEPTIKNFGVEGSVVSKDKMPTIYYVEFTDGKCTKLTENGSVEILETKPASETTIWTKN